MNTPCRSTRARTQNAGKAAAYTACVYLDGRLLQSIPLDQVAETRRFTVDAADGGYNIVEVSPGGIAIAETIYDMNNPTGKLPMAMPRDMASVEAQESDISFDLEDPLYEYGFGLSYGE